jgi:hypothetical protein
MFETGCQNELRTNTLLRGPSMSNELSTGVTITEGSYEFFPIIDDFDWNMADTVLSSNGNYTGSPPTPEMLQAFQQWLSMPGDTYETL